MPGVFPGCQRGVSTLAAQNSCLPRLCDASISVFLTAPQQLLSARTWGRGAFSVMHLLLPFDRRIKGTPCNAGSSVSAQLPSLQQLTLQYQQLPQPRALVSVSPTRSDHYALPGLHVLVRQPRNCTKQRLVCFLFSGMTALYCLLSNV